MSKSSTISTSRSMTATSNSTTNNTMNGSSTTKLSVETMTEYQEAFKFFDKDNDGFVEMSEVGRLMRSVGLFPSESEIHHMQKTMGRTKCDFNDFLQLASSSLVDASINEQQMREAFRMFDAYGNGFVNLMQMRNALQNLGEKLRDDEIDELIREADIDAEGNVNYEELVKILCRS